MNWRNQMHCCHREEDMLLCAYGELAPEKREEFLRHAQTCPSCRAALTVIKDISAYVRGSAPDLPEASAVMLREKAAAVIGSRARDLRTQFGGRAKDWVFAGALAAMAVFVFYSVLPRNNGTAWNDSLSSRMDAAEYSLAELRFSGDDEAFIKFELECNAVESEKQRFEKSLEWREL
ncbi:MAG: hypothetical protein ABIG11_03225 [bacterium]